MLDASTWSSKEGAGPERMYCPGCGGGLPAEALAAGQRLARCRQCGQLVRRVVRRAWPGESGPTAFDWGGPIAEESRPRLEIAPGYPPPALQCPYCEHLNQDGSSYRPNGQQFCANCGADLKKLCLACDAPMYVLDHFCTRCRSDQERLKYEVEGLYWQHYNEGKRLAQLGRWADAEHELGLFFNPPPQLDREQVRRARQVYVSQIAPHDGEAGLQLYNEAVAELRQLELERDRALQRDRARRWVAGGVVLVALGLLSTLTFGTWWAIFLIAPVIIIGLVLVILFILTSLGLG